MPNERGVEPSHAEARGLFPVQEEAPAGLRTLAAPAGSGAALEIRQDATVYAGRALADAPIRYAAEEGRGAFVHAVRGRLLVNGTTLDPGDALALENESGLKISGDPAADFLLFDLA